MEPNIRNHRSANLAEGAARLVALDDNPTTCTLSYSRIEPGKTSSHHIHPWEHEVYVIKGSGTLICDGKEYPVKEGDAMFIPGNVDHYTLNYGGQGDILRIEINPLEAARSGGARNEGGPGTGQPPVIRNHKDLNTDTGSRILSTKDGALARASGVPGCWPNKWRKPQPPDSVPSPSQLLLDRRPHRSKPPVSPPVRAGY